MKGRLVGLGVWRFETKNSSQPQKWRRQKRTHLTLMGTQPSSKIVSPPLPACTHIPQEGKDKDFFVSWCAALELFKGGKSI